MTQSEAISLAALVISGLIGALWLMWRERVATLERDRDKLRDQVESLASRQTRSETMQSSADNNSRRLSDALDRFDTKVDELARIVAGLTSEVRRRSPMPTEYQYKFVDPPKGQGER